ncbi:MAG: S8 family serine peptidase, partial [Alphaproteobacteria bacterium]
MTRCGVINSALKSTALKAAAGAFGLALLMASPAGAASVESPPVVDPSAPPGAAVANTRADRDGDRIEDALGARIAAGQAGEQFDVIVMFDGPDAVGRSHAAAGPFEVTREFSIINGYQAQLTAPQIRGLSRAPGLFRISANGTVKALDIPSNDDMGVTDARFDFNFDGSGVTICIIDTGIDGPHEQFDTMGPGGGPLTSAEFYDAVIGQPNPYDDHGHGSHVSGIAAGDGTGASPFAGESIGVAPGASLVAAKVLDADGQGTEDQVLDGIGWCAARGDVDIMSMSLGSGPTDGSDAISVAVNCAADPSSSGTCSGTNLPKIVVVAAGNSGALWSTIGAPGVAEFAITVGSIAEWSGNPSANWQDDGLYLNTFSSRGPVLDGSPDGRIKPDISAPGSRVASAWVGGSANVYVVASGTSMATPFVSGVIALMLEADFTLGIEDGNGLPHQKVRAILATTAVDRGATGKDNEYGHGVIDAYAAVAIADGVTNPVPTAYPGYTRLANQSVADVANPPAFPSDDFASWTWEFTATDSITPIAGTAIIHETNHADVV